MDYYTQLNEGEKEPLSKPITTLPVLLFSEYKKYKQEERGGRVYQRTKAKMLEELRELAFNNNKWGDMAASISKTLVSVAVDNSIIQ